MAQTAVASRYDTLTGDRSAYLVRAREAALLTIPSAFPPEGNTGVNTLYKPYQGIGSRAVKSLAAKISMTMLPANAPFFRLQISEADIADQSIQTRGKIEESLAAIERLVFQELESLKLRPVLNAVSLQLLIAGNVLLYLGKDGVKFYRLDKYVVKRDGFGIPIEIIIKEEVSLATLPPAIQQRLKNEATEDQDLKNLHLYTVCRRSGKTWKRHQEVRDIRLPGTNAVYTADRCPYVPLRLVVMDGEDYGRGYIEEHIGDLHSLENLTKAIVEAALSASKVVWMVNPNSSTRLAHLQKAKNGDFLTGSMDDVTALQMDKFADLSVARATAAEIEKGLAESFLMSSSAQRNGERVTATEIRAVTQELETILGGIYSLLSEELQLPMVNILLGRLTDAGKVPSLPKDTLKPRVITGIDGLGRGQDIQQLQGFISGLAQLVGPEAVSANLHLHEFLSRWAAAWSLDANGLVVTEAERKQQQQKAVDMQMLQSLGPKMMEQGAASGN